MRVWLHTKTERQKYKLVNKEKGYEIRYYPSATLATVHSTSSSYRTLAYRKLAGFILGGNETNTNIAMTSPVHMEINDSASSMSFVLPSSYLGKKIPKPNDPGIIVEQTDSEYIAAISFRGYTSNRGIKKYAEKLRNLLEKNGIDYCGNFRCLGYNPSTSSGLTKVQRTLSVPERLVYTLYNWHDLLPFPRKRRDRQNGVYIVGSSYQYLSMLILLFNLF